MLEVKFVRMEKELTQWSISKATGIPQGRYSMIERGLIDPTEAERAGLAKVLNANPATLFRSALRGLLSTGKFQPELASA